MKTVKEVSMITGVSIRTLRYYDEIGLLKPTELTESGYRLYDNKALEKLLFMSAKESENMDMERSAVEQFPIAFPVIEPEIASIL